MDKERLKSLYAELQGYLSQVPDTTQDNWSRDKRMWDQFNFVVEELQRLTLKDYSRFLLKPETRAMGASTNPQYYEAIRISTYKTTLGGLIAKLHVEYFENEEEPPFKTMPNTIINTNQYQSQSQEQQQSIVIDLAMIIAEKKGGYEKGSSEWSFLDKLGNAIKNTKNVADVVKTIVSLAQTCGISLSTLTSIFG